MAPRVTYNPSRRIRECGMPEIAFHTNGAPFLELRDALTKKRTWAIIFAYLASLFLMARWPNIFGIAFEFSLLCFPVGLFVWAAIFSGAIHRPPMTKIVITIIVFHCAMLAGTVYLWRRNPKSITGDFGFGFIVIELAAIWLLGRLLGPRREAQGPSRG